MNNNYEEKEKQVKKYLGYVPYYPKVRKINIIHPVKATTIHIGAVILATFLCKSNLLLKAK